MPVKSNYFFFFVLTVSFCLCAVQGFAQHAPKREMRGAWIATVANIDWPSKPGLPADIQKGQFIRLLDELKSLGMNTVVVQIRPAADAFYASEIEPWSYWLTGRQGMAPVPYYDPLDFMISETHKRGMDFHAWFNPYRAVMNIHKKNIAPDNITLLHPDWFVNYGDKKYFNPGLPAVWHYLVKVVDDVVSRYDIDAVQFDDYFYPYRIRGREFPDYSTFREYGNGRSIDDWRRHNVDTVIEMISRSIKQQKPWVRFGISPFGVWRNRDRDPDGSLTRAGQTDYDDLYADVLLWLRKGWIDYVSPQLYWEFGNRYAPYEILLDWWAHHTYGRQLYIGQALYRIGGSAAWRNPAEMPAEIRANRTNPDVKGSMYFSASGFYKNPLGFDDSLRNDLYKYPALLPRMPWIDSIPPSPPHLLGTMSLPDGLLLQWKDGDTTGQSSRFVIYRFPGDSTGDFGDPAYILAIVSKSHPDDAAYIQSYLDKGYLPGNHYVYAVTSLDRLHNESDPGNLLYIPARRQFSPSELYDPHTPAFLSPPLERAHAPAAEAK
ncbi:MAG TPA: family 10 glycosylhydrolase [Chitinophagaceae bacterium]|nr:family 10 glycosylhydrolase [Chitinophagaceae bacterium]